MADHIAPACSMKKVLVPVIIAVTLIVPSNIAEEDKISEQRLREIKTWPKVFVLNRDPSFPVVCYAGVTFNESNNNADAPSPGNKTESVAEKDSIPSLLSLSSDPLYPVTCRVGHISGNLTDGNTTYLDIEKEENDGTNITCIRRDYEKNISAIFIYDTGPIQFAWNLFNTTLPYGYMTVSNVECIGSIKVLNETVVDCGDYGFTVGDKNIGANTACALCG